MRHAKDTGMTDADEDEDGAKKRRAEQAAARKRQRREAIRERPQIGSCSNSTSTAKPLADVVEVGLQRQLELSRDNQTCQNKLSAIKLMLDFGSSEQKQEALKQLEGFA